MWWVGHQGVDGGVWMVGCECWGVEGGVWMGGHCDDRELNVAKKVCCMKLNVYILNKERYAQLKL